VKNQEFIAAVDSVDGNGRKLRQIDCSDPFYPPGRADRQFLSSQPAASAVLLSCSGSVAMNV
jgi:hypothetical protein